MAELTGVIRVFISSKQAEFHEERRGMADVIRQLPLLAADVAEEWAPERNTVEDRYLAGVRAAPIFVGLFGSIFSAPTANEYDAAIENPHREVLTYVKRCATVEPPLADLIRRFDDPREGHTVRRFDLWADLKPYFEQHLWAAVRRMIQNYMSLADSPPVARSASGVMAARWQRERDHLLSLGLPDAADRTRAQAWADRLTKMLETDQHIGH
jgi:hypothetical protein